jgi:hypothetical protein
VAVKGFVTSEKFVRGRSPQEVERILGILPGELKDGAVLLRLNILPLPHQYELRGYTQTPAGEPYSGGAYPPGHGANQWELTVEVPATIVKIVPAGQRL